MRLSSLLTIATLFLLPILAAAQQVYTDLSSQPEGKIYFNSVTPKSKWDLVHRKYDKTPTVIWANLYLPREIKGRIPAMVISHGSAGLQDKDVQRWARAFNEMGIAAFVVDSFGPRNIANTEADQGKLNAAANDADALAALRLLATDPRIDPQKIGQIGFSRGGGVALEMTMESFRKGIIDDDTRFAALIAFYPGCPQVWWTTPAPRLSGAPLMMALGEKDNYTPARLCQNFAEIMQRDQQQVEVHVYPGAYHDFDNTTPYFKYHPMATSAQKCPQVQFDMEHGEYRYLLTGEKLASLAAVEELIKACLIRGVSTGSNIEQGNRAEADVRVFLQKAFHLQ
ncbi:dienelactone hydrolase family protein [Undibacterium sp. TJN25]|uniref:dienelactone hydrolase family protein n=1 Tax=Undibacterium sp. TJN25 TaxID=3413056 RepID=UPI003BF1D1DB